MRNLLIWIVAALALSFSGPHLGAAQRFDLKPERLQLKTRQKEEWKALKLRQKYQKQSWKNRSVHKSVRMQMKHQMQREKRELREKQKDELQDFKDRQRLVKENQKRWNQ